MEMISSLKRMLSPRVVLDDEDLPGPPQTPPPKGLALFTPNKENDPSNRPRTPHASPHKKSARHANNQPHSNHQHHHHNHHATPSKPPTVGFPIRSTHDVHVESDASASSGFRGLPAPLEKRLLRTPAAAPADARPDPDAALRAFQHYLYGAGAAGTSTPASLPPATPPRKLKPTPFPPTAQTLPVQPPSVIPSTPPAPPKLPPATHHHTPQASRPAPPRAPPSAPPVTSPVTRPPHAAPAPPRMPPNTPPVPRAPPAGLTAQRPPVKPTAGPRAPPTKPVKAGKGGNGGPIKAAGVGGMSGHAGMPKMMMGGVSPRPAQRAPSRRAAAAMSVAPSEPVYIHNQNPRDVFSDIKQIGQGASGSVYVAMKRSGQRVALKKVKPSNKTEVDALEMEIRMMCCTRHPNLIKCHETYHYSGFMWISMEYMDGGCLTRVLEHMQGVRSYMSEGVIAFVLREVLRGLRFMHGMKRLHRDIKSDNVLITGQGQIKLADFGFCVELTEERKKRTTCVGTPHWMAPELIRESEYDYKVDLWSVGILAIECAEWEPPHLDEQPVRAMLRITAQPPPTLNETGKWSREFNDFIARCLVHDPAKRATADELLAHAFIRKAADSSDFARLLAATVAAGQ